MTLADFIRRYQTEVVGEWESFAATLLPAAADMSRSALRDHIHEILDAIATDIESPQSEKEKAAKAKGHGRPSAVGTVGKIHAALRIETGFELEQVIAEYRALRASILRLWARHRPDRDLEQMTRFNEAIDEALIEAAARFAKMMDEYRDRFVAMLAHDLRNPLGAIVFSAERMLHPGVDPAEIAGRLLPTAWRMERLIADILDFARARFGTPIHVAPAPMDLDPICRQVVDELQPILPAGEVRYRAAGDLHGDWDGDRIAQVLSNLIRNAMQHGAPGQPVYVVARGHRDEVSIEVHNEGPPIPTAVAGQMFEPMVRSARDERHRSTSVGLGLYIAREVVNAHGGTLGFTSTAKRGTTFTVRLPRHRPEAAAGVTIH